MTLKQIKAALNYARLGHCGARIPDMHGPLMVSHSKIRIFDSVTKVTPRYAKDR